MLFRSQGRRPSPSHLAYHLRVLERCGAVERRREDGRVLFRLAAAARPSPTAQAKAWMGVRLSAKAQDAVRQAEQDLELPGGSASAPPLVAGGPA